MGPRRAAAVNDDAGNPLNILIKQPCQSGFFGTKRFHALCQNPAHPRFQPGQTRHVESPGFQRGGHFGRVGFGKAVHPAAAHHQRGHLQPGPDVKPARALRPQQCLVAGKAKHIKPQLLHIDGPGTRRLGRIHDHQKSMGFG